MAVDILARPTGDDIADQSDDSSESVTLPSGKVNLEIASVTRNGVLKQQQNSQLNGELRECQC